MSFLACFVVSANIFCFYLLCTYIVYILKCGEKKKKTEMAETNVIQFVINGVLFHVRALLFRFPVVLILLLPFLTVLYTN